ncbi:hypothetical protein B4144_2114 [Bacillus atrophaeus]|nr:hypothetical protein B4144_2114 [Bacillus atrophaeus]
MTIQQKKHLKNESTKCFFSYLQMINSEKTKTKLKSISRDKRDTPLG